MVAPKIFIWRRADSADDTCDDFSVVGGNMGSNLEQPVSTSALNVTVSNADIGTLRYCCQVSITDLGGIDVSGNSMTSITVVGESACVHYFLLVLLLAFLPGGLHCRVLLISEVSEITMLFMPLHYPS